MTSAMSSKAPKQDNFLADNKTERGNVLIYNTRWSEKAANEAQSIWKPRTAHTSSQSSIFNFPRILLWPKMANHSYSHNLSNRSVLVRNYLLHEFDIGRCVACVSLIVSSLLSNSVIVFSYCLNYKMRTTTNTMVLNHCLVDIFLALSDIAFYLTPAYVPRLMDSDLFCNLSVSFDSLLKAASGF